MLTSCSIDETASDCNHLSGANLQHIPAHLESSRSSGVVDRDGRDKCKCSWQKEQSLIHGAGRTIDGVCLDSGRETREVAGGGRCHRKVRSTRTRNTVKCWCIQDTAGTQQGLSRRSWG